jgi:class 3 adenylate cyclase/tetratricopeptide (TPR) repeat protein
MQCPECQFDNRQGAKFCKNCGTELFLICPQCNTPYTPDSSFCDECGFNLLRPVKAPTVNYSEPQSYTPKHLADKILSSRSNIEGERKLVTVLFADVANYTSIAEKLDPEVVHNIMDGCFTILMDEIHRYEGTINQFTGDGVMALFGAPVSHEDHAQRACYAALTIQKSLDEYGAMVERDRGVEFKMRIGINTGKVIVGAIGDDLRMDYTAVGDTTNLASRIQQMSEPGEVSLSHETQSIIKGFFKVEYVGDHALKGKAEKQSIYRLNSEHKEIRTRFEASLSHGVTELVGRGPEMQILKSAWDRARSGEARIVDVVGEAGVGKSRLIYEFQNALADDAIFLTGVCIHYGRNINFLPLIEIVRSVFSIEEEMSEEEAGRLIEDIAVGKLESMIPFYRNLLSLQVDDEGFKALDPEGRKFGTFEGVKNLLLSLSEKKPLVIFLEDVHWIDKISEEFFTFFSHPIHQYRILILTAYRPESTPGWSKGSLYRHLGLETLSEKSSGHLVRNILGGLELDNDLEKIIVSKTGGNPFYVEEIIRELMERNELMKHGMRYVLRNPIDHLKIPGTVQGIIAARMDRLSEDLKKTMQVASVIGRDFGYKILRSILELGDELRTHLTNLVGIEILYEKALYPELEYIFKHALTQEVAYESLLKQRRKEIHRRIAKTIEELYAENLGEHYELLAYHYEQSGNGIKATNYLILAGEKSNENASAQTAFEFFNKALSVTKSQKLQLDGEAKVRIHSGLAQSSFQIGDSERCVKESRRSIELSRQYKLIDFERDNLSLLAVVMTNWPEKAEAQKSYEDGLARAQEIKDKGLESSILSMMGTRAAIDGQFYKGYQICIKAEKLVLETDDLVGHIMTRVNRSFAERWIGRPEKTVELTEGMAEMARQMGNFYGLSYLASFRGIALAEVGRTEEGIDILKKTIDLCEEFGVSFRLACLYNCLGYCYGEIHQPESAMALNCKAEEIAQALMGKYSKGKWQYAEMLAQSKVNQMENLYDQRKLEDAWNLILNMEKTSKSKDFDMFRYQWQSRMNYLKAKILIDRNELGPAEEIIRHNIENTSKNKMRKREGGFLRLLGEVQITQNQFDNAIDTLNKAVHILTKTGNRKLIWESYSTRAVAFNRLKRLSDEKESWSAANKIITEVADALSDRDLKSGFLSAKPIQDIILKN